jgi:hypothetical protein
VSNIGSAAPYVLSIIAGLGLATAITRYEPPELDSPPAAFDYTDTLAAFPGAEGRGAIALDMARDSVADGSWNFEIHIVTDTSTTGPGTLDSVRTEILADATAYHLVVFNVAGGFAPSEFNLTNIKNTYFACQTAPGTGFRFRTVWKRGDADSPDDLLARYCHFKPTGSSSSLIQVWSARRVMFDHVSVMFNSSDDLFEFYGQQDGTNTWTHEDITVSWSLIGVGVTSGATGLAFHNDNLASDSRWGYVDAHHNVMGHLQNRAPKCNIDGTANERGCKFVSNYAYNVAGQAFDTSDTVRYDAIENVVRAGPSWDGDKDRFFAHDTSHVQSDDPNPADILLSGNRVVGGPAGWNPPATQDSLLWSQDITKLGGGATWRTYTKLADAVHPIVATVSSGLLAAIKDEVGAYQRVSCNGTMVAARDAQDSTLIAHVSDGALGPNTGYYASRTAANTAGFGAITRNAGTPCAFGTNSLPDSFEIRYFGVADTVTASGDHDDDGYLTAEEWVNGTNPVSGPTAGDTYGDGRIAYIMSLQTDTFISNAGQDTITALVINPDSQPASYRLYNLGTDKAVVLTYDGLGGWTARDSAEMEDTLSNRSLTPSPALYNMAVPGEP